METDSVPTKQTLVQERSSISARSHRKWARPFGALVVFLLIIATIAIKPPFVIKRMAGRAAPGATDQQAVSPAAAILDPICMSKVIPTILEKADDIAAILP